ncbi:hypothetical protein CMUS01_15677 [Colletotrichum musicola]|uniref:Uncharacterized protein n=1 Tax=Colletotrichum musicola TaxID=2175873 RepID=A0A8H6MLE8_9PEZI|nr:hypothetical protein CMUS01_15677 [Colletotrichum musicola]
MILNSFILSLPSEPLHVSHVAFLLPLVALPQYYILSVGYLLLSTQAPNHPLCLAVSPPFKRPSLPLTATPHATAIPPSLALFLQPRLFRPPTSQALHVRSRFAVPLPDEVENNVPCVRCARSALRGSSLGRCVKTKNARCARCAKSRKGGCTPVRWDTADDANALVFLLCHGGTHPVLPLLLPESSTPYDDKISELESADDKMGEDKPKPTHPKHPKHDLAVEAQEAPAPVSSRPVRRVLL